MQLIANCDDSGLLPGSVLDGELVTICDQVRADAEDECAAGAVWAFRSGGRCLFVMPTAGDFSGITRVIERGGAITRLMWSLLNLNRVRGPSSAGHFSTASTLSERPRRRFQDIGQSVTLD